MELKDSAGAAIDRCLDRRRELRYKFCHPLFGILKGNRFPIVICQHG